MLSMTKNWANRMAYRGVLSRQRVQIPTSGIVLSYGPGNGNLSAAPERVTGGRVKLTYLQHQYPHDGGQFNILYLVSSALPPAADLLAKWAKRHGAKIVMNQNGVAYPAWTDNPQPINDELSEIMTLTDLVIFQSQFCMDAAHRFLSSCGRRSVVLPNCVDTTEFTVSPTREDGPIRLLIAGTHYQPERVTLGLHALRDVLDSGIPANLHVAGRLAWEGAERETTNLIEQLGVSTFVEISGSYTFQNAKNMYTNADILLHLKYKDPCPNVVIEAMACGLGIIGSRSGGLPELVKPDSGILLPVGDSWDEMCYPSVEAIAAGILELASSLTERRQASRKAAERMFDSDVWVEQHTILFRALLSG